MDDDEKYNRLLQLTHSVVDTYNDFVLAITISAKRYHYMDQMIQFMEENPDATSSEIIEYQNIVEDELGLSYDDV